jgi:cyclophilin family peptidyl-prolyl cis-trans isomerase
MRRLAQKIWNLLRHHQSSKKRRPRLFLEPLEDRLTPATAGFTNTAPGVVTGLVYLDTNNNNIFDPGEIVVPGANVTLMGNNVDATATTDANGHYTFFQVKPGTYSLILQSSGTFLNGQGGIGNLGGTVGANSVTQITVAEGQTGVNYDLGLRGVTAGFVSLRDFLASFTPGSDIPFSSAGAGSTAADHTVQPTAAATAGTSTLSGAVKNGSTGLGGVEVTLSGIDSTGRDIFLTTTTVAGNTGFYQFTNLNPGTYTLNVPVQPAGFRADLPTIGALGGEIFRNDQIIDITVGTGVTGSNYNFAEVPLTAPVNHAGPVIAAQLADDTAANTGTTSDSITSDPTIVGSVTDSGASITALTARFTGSSVNILDHLGSNGTFLLNTALLTQINGGTLPDGTYTLHLTATDALGRVSTFDVPTFTLVTTPPAVPTLQIENPRPTVTSVPGAGQFTVTFGYFGAEATMSADGTNLTGTTTVSVATTIAGTDTSAAVQTITFDPSVTGGTFTLTFNNVTSGPITWSSDTATLQGNIQTALNSLIGSQPDSNNKATIGGVTSAGAHVLLQQGSPTVADVNQNSVSVTFQFPGPQNTMTADGTDLTGTSPTVSVSTTTPGVLPTTVAVQTIAFGGTVTGGTFTLTFTDQNSVAHTTGPITWSATTADLVANIQAALNHIIGAQSTTAAGDGSFRFNVTMSPGASKFIVHASDNAANISKLSTSLVNPIALTNPAAQTVNMTHPSVAGDTSNDQNVNLTGLFTDPNLANSVVTFNTSAGPMNVQLLDGTAPQTVDNFLNYVAQGSYNNDVFHRLDTNPPVLQGGGFTFQTNPSKIVPVGVNPTIKNEFNAAHPDVAGTIAMAKQASSPDSASSQFFFNLADNSTTLGSSNNGGFTVFGQVQSGADQRILNTLAAFPVKNETQTVFEVAFTTPGPKPTMTVANNSLTGTQPTINVATTVNGATPSTQAIQTITFGGTISGGTFKLTVGSATTGDITWSSNSATLAANIQTALNSLANTNVTATSSTNPFNVFPVKNYNGSPFPAGATASNFSVISSIGTTVAPTDHLTFQVTGNSASSIASASINANNWLLIHPLQAGSTTITVTATDNFGSTAQVTFNVTVT